MLLLISLVFTAAGVFIVAQKGEPTGFAVIAFFGGCTAVAVWMLVRKTRARRDLHAESIDIIGGVPLRANRTAATIAAVGMTVMGTVMALTGPAIGTIWVGLSYLIALIGVVLIAMILRGTLASQYLQFEPEGLVFGRSDTTFILAWDNIAALGRAVIGDHDALLIHVHDTDALLLSVLPQDRATRSQKRLAKTIRSNRAWWDADLLIMPVHYGTSIVLLARVIHRYATDLQGRAGLAAKLQLPEDLDG